MRYFARWQSVLRTYVLSSAIQTGAQLVAGEIVISVFFWRSGLRSKTGCLLSTLYILTSLLIPTDNTIGSKLLASSILMGSTWLSSLLAGVVVSLC